MFSSFSLPLSLIFVPTILIFTKFKAYLHWKGSSESEITSLVFRGRWQLLTWGKFSFVTAGLKTSAGLQKLGQHYCPPSLLQSAVRVLLRAGPHPMPVAQLCSLLAWQA